MPSKFHQYSLLVAVAAGVLISACGEDPFKPPLSDGVMATFAVTSDTTANDTFKVWITNSQASADVVAAWNGQSDKRIPHGKLNLGPGTLAYNQPWAWHIDQDDVMMVSSAPEECDGTPSEVEADLDGWINSKGEFCPSGSQLIFLESL